MANKKVCVILVNLGTPEKPDASSVRTFLNRFLSDKRVVSIPDVFWQPLLKGIILPLRSPKVAKLYQKIWLEDGSPLQVYSERLAVKVAQLVGNKAQVKLAMSYSQPLLDDVLQQSIDEGCEKLIVLPLYPQYSVSTSASVFDGCARVFNNNFAIPSFEFIRQYYDFPGYCQTLAKRIESRGITYSREHPLVFSFHGIPLRYAQKGDPYPSQCEATAQSVAKILGLDSSAYKLSYQSRFGKEPWLQPYTDEMLTSLAKDGVKAVDILSPAFAVDCLETLEEISHELKDIFIENGGEQFYYHKALNDGDDHAELLAQLVLAQLKGEC
ncbi:ferrochelatase [Celerinatantimonas sp. MCCC 1A17872]|uniref:ferrochelatase n=1 Tax=Celerinatantimonas sp. MCCC 1A17872 TaxID=3177514 RepID=UPI0038CA9D58